MVIFALSLEFDARAKVDRFVSLPNQRWEGVEAASHRRLLPTRSLPTHRTVGRWRRELSPRGRRARRRGLRQAALLGVAASAGAGLGQVLGPRLCRVRVDVVGHVLEALLPLLERHVERLVKI